MAEHVLASSPLVYFIQLFRRGNVWDTWHWSLGETSPSRHCQRTQRMTEHWHQPVVWPHAVFIDRPRYDL